MDVIQEQPKGTKDNHSHTCCNDACDLSSKKHICHCYSPSRTFMFFPGFNCICDACAECMNGSPNKDYVLSRNCCNSVEDPCCYDVSWCFCPCVCLCDIVTLPLRICMAKRN